MKNKADYNQFFWRPSRFIELSIAKMRKRLCVFLSVKKNKLFAIIKRIEFSLKLLFIYEGHILFDIYREPGSQGANKEYPGPVTYETKLFRLIKS